MGWYKNGNWSGLTALELKYVLAELTTACYEREKALGRGHKTLVGCPWKEAYDDAVSKGYNVDGLGWEEWESTQSYKRADGMSVKQLDPEDAEGMSLLTESGVDSYFKTNLEHLSETIRQLGHFVVAGQARTHQRIIVHNVEEQIVFDTNYSAYFVDEDDYLTSPDVSMTPTTFTRWQDVNMWDGFRTALDNLKTVRYMIWPQRPQAYKYVTDPRPFDGTATHREAVGYESYQETWTNMVGASDTDEDSNAAPPDYDNGLHWQCDYVEDWPPYYAESHADWVGKVYATDYVKGGTGGRLEAYHVVWLPTIKDSVQYVTYSWNGYSWNENGGTGINSYTVLDHAEELPFAYWDVKGIKFTAAWPNLGTETPGVTIACAPWPPGGTVPKSADWKNAAAASWILLFQNIGAALTYG
jgi:hypothetical protein